MMKISVIITGATGMVGEGVLHECLQHPEVEKILVVNRKPCGVTHPKLTEIIHGDFFDLTPVQEAFHGYNACFFCLGVSSVGMKADKYRRLTYDLTVNFAKKLALPGNELTFCYVSGMGTDSTVRGKSMWARVKGQTENDLRKLPFRAAYMFRPGYIQPTKGLSHTHGILIPISWLYPIWHTLFPRHVCTLRELGLAMIKVASMGYEKPVLEPEDIVAAAGF